MKLKSFVLGFCVAVVAPSFILPSDECLPATKVRVVKCREGDIRTWFSERKWGLIAAWLITQIGYVPKTFDEGRLISKDDTAPVLLRDDAQVVSQWDLDAKAFPCLSGLDETGYILSFLYILQDGNFYRISSRLSDDGCLRLYPGTTSLLSDDNLFTANFGSFGEFRTALCRWKEAALKKDDELKVDLCCARQLVRSPLDQIFALPRFMRVVALIGEFDCPKMAESYSIILGDSFPSEVDWGVRRFLRKYVRAYPGGTLFVLKLSTPSHFTPVNDLFGWYYLSDSWHGSYFPATFQDDSCVKVVAVLGASDFANYLYRSISSIERW